LLIRLPDKDLSEDLSGETDDSKAVEVFTETEGELGVTKALLPPTRRARSPA
jgi:hypothetical protein